MQHKYLKIFNFVKPAINYKISLDTLIETNKIRAIVGSLTKFIC